MFFNQEFDEFVAWRRAQAQRLLSLSEWMVAHDLLDVGVRERLNLLQTHLRSDRFVVVFLAEFSRGKSELINAVFFADYGRRIIPTSPGRTTMCPTEMAYEADTPPSLRLLPIETRLQPQSLLEWRQAPQHWECIDLDVNEPAQIAKAMEKVAEVRRVTVAEARALGFWHDDRPDDNPLCGADGLIDVPRWRHALVNMAHPLLKQGLVIIDTPGLNAIGAEPDLSLGLLPQAHAVVFVLAADAGVSQSDLKLWREYLAPALEYRNTRLVVLNKIDALWDELSQPDHIDAQIRLQCAHAAAVLGLRPQQLQAVSAQKGLLAKVRQDPALLEKSRLPELERALVEDVLGSRLGMLRASMNTTLEQARTELGQQLQLRAGALADQMQELESLQGKNDTVIRQMRMRIEQEQSAFESSGAHIQAVRSVHRKLHRAVLTQLGSERLKVEVAHLTQALAQPGLKLGVKQVYAQVFAQLRAGLGQAQGLAAEVQDMLTGSFRSLNVDYGFTLQEPQRLDLSAHVQTLTLIEHHHLQHLGLSNVLRLAQPVYAERLAKAVMMQLLKLYEDASNDVELWSLSAFAHLDEQLRERRNHFASRFEAVQRIQTAAGGLDERIAQLQEQIERVHVQMSELKGLTTVELDVPPQAFADATPSAA